jgi:alpha-L-rhamnosidase
MNRGLFPLKQLTLCSLAVCGTLHATVDIEENFLNPPDSARPGVYWYFLDGNLNGKEMTADLESMKAAGIGNLVFLEVDIGGVKRGPVAFMSPKWQELFVQSVRDAERLGIDITLGIGPGWCGSGGPWVKPEQSMQHLVFSTVDIKGPQSYSAVLPLPEQRSTEWHNMADAFYQDVTVLAFPSRKPVIADIDEKALFRRDPYSIRKMVKPYLPTAADYQEPGPEAVIQPDGVLDLTGKLKPDGTLNWDVPAGEWTVVRMGRRVTGASSRPAPSTALGLECDKFDAKAVEDHLDQYVGKLLTKIGPRAEKNGLTTLHMDSWESGAQNWTPSLLDEFKKRRGYDARPWLPTYTGRAVRSLEMSERFLWDLRLTGQELVLENHAGAVKNYGRKHGLSLSIEPYDMNPSGDLDLGAVADVPMAEFWSNSIDSAYSCFESTSIAHVMGKPIVSAEAFTAVGALDAYPWSLKNQGDWAFCVGINRFVFHTFAHQTVGEEYKPGMTFGPYGVSWHRNQTWWPMVSDYHRYLSRCSEMLRQGVTVSDVLYLTPEGTPHIFMPPPSALEGSGILADKKGYGFDGCSPKILMARAEVKNGLIAFPGGTSYRLMVLPQVETMTPALLAKIRDLVKAGATIVGPPPLKSPSLTGYPACDDEVKAIASDLWGGLETPKSLTKRGFGKGVVHWGGEPVASPPLYPSYETTSALLRDMGVMEDFTATGPVRYGHRRTEDKDIYFVANRTNNPLKVDCRFRVSKGRPQLWDPVTGKQRPLPQFEQTDGLTSVPMCFDAFQSFFVVFEKVGTDRRAVRDESENGESIAPLNFPDLKPFQELTGSWDLAFDPKWGGPEKITFDNLQDWTTRSEPGIKYYSGIATYRKNVNVADVPKGKTHLDLGVVHDMARVRLNGKDLGVVWCAPWRIEVTDAIKAGDNSLEIEVVNRWANRLIGDKQPADANARTVERPEGLLGAEPIKTGRHTFTTHDPYKNDSPLVPSGLLGPVRIYSSDR